MDVRSKQTMIAFGIALYNLQLINTDRLTKTMMGEAHKNTEKWILITRKGL